MKYIFWTVISRTACAFAGNWGCDTAMNYSISTSPSPSSILSRSSWTKNHFYRQLCFWSMRSLEKEVTLLASVLPCKGWDTASLSWCLWRLQACPSHHWRRAPHLYTLWECYRGKPDKLKTTSVTALTHIHHAGRRTAHQKLNIIPKDSVLMWALQFFYWTDSDDLCRVEEFILPPCSSSTKGRFKWQFLFPKPSGWGIPLSAWEEMQCSQGTRMGWGVWNNHTEAKVPPQHKPLPPSSSLNPAPATTQELL